MKKERFIYIGIIVFLIIVFGNASMNENNKGFKVNGSNEDIKDSLLKSNIEQENINAKIVVDICGAVRKPGILQLDNGMRVADAVFMAEGFRSDVDRKKVNMAKKLIDGQQIYIPSINEEVRDESKESLININEATAEELTKLVGIGEATAAKIIEYRSKNGKFQKNNDIMNIIGIGSKKYDSIKEFICCY